MEQSSSSASQEIPAFYGTRRFITVLTRGCHWSLSWSEWIHSTHTHTHTHTHIPF